MIVDEDRFKSWLSPQPKIPSLEESMVICQLLADQFPNETGPRSKIVVDLNNTILILWQMHQLRHVGQYHQPLMQEILDYTDATDFTKFLTSSPGPYPLPDFDPAMQRMKEVQRRCIPPFTQYFKKPFKAVEDPSFVKLTQSLQVVLADDAYNDELKTALLRTTQQVSFVLSLMQHPEHHALVKSMSMEDIRIENGPVSPNELLLCALFYMMQSGIYAMYDDEEIANATEIPNFENPVSSAYLLGAMAFAPVLEDLMTYLAEQQSDLGDPQKIIQDMAETHAQKLVPIVDSHLMGAERLMVLTKYYYEHNQHKLGGSAEFAAILMNMELTLAVIVMGISPDLSTDPVVQQRHHEILMEKVPDLLACEIPKPSLAQVIQECEVAIDRQEKGKPQKAARMKEKFHAARADMPVGMEEVILLHYAEREEVRDLRKRLFGPQKEEFLKYVAVENSEELRALGLSQQQIARMKEDGKIPEGSDLTVEHIIDRHHGGTNHAHNFIVLPREINLKKDELKKRQLRAYGDAANKACWIISWVPKKLEDGTYPPVWPVPANQDFSVQAQMEAACPNPPQL